MTSELKLRCGQDFIIKKIYSCVKNNVIIITALHQTYFLEEEKNISLKMDKNYSTLSSHDLLL